MKQYDLPCMDARKSFYGKAQVLEDGATATLLSYGTPVLRVAGGKAERLWNGYSMTTMRHVNSFCQLRGINGGGKAWWDSLPAKS